MGAYAAERIDLVVELMKHHAHIMVLLFPQGWVRGEGGSGSHV